MHFGLGGKIQGGKLPAQLQQGGIFGIGAIRRGRLDPQAAVELAVEAVDTLSVHWHPPFPASAAEHEGTVENDAHVALGEAR